MATAIKQRFPLANQDEPLRSGSGLGGKVRLGKRTKRLIKYLGPGEIAIIAHADLDRVSAEELIACKVQAVINTQPFSTGKYPNMGPALLADAGIPLVESLESDLFELLKDGDVIEIKADLAGVTDQPVQHAEVIYHGGQRIADCVVLSCDEVRARTEQLRADVGDALEAFARNTVEHMVEERELLSGKLDLPLFATDFRDRPVLIVVRGVDHQRDLLVLRPYIRDVKPVIIAVDGGADAVCEVGLVPDMIVGDMDSATEAALRSGAELVVHAYPDGRAPGRELLDKLNLDYKIVPAPGTSQDIAMLIAAEKGAELVVSVGSQFNLIEFLDKSRRGMSSTFLTRLRLGELLIDAKGVSRLYRPRPTLTPVLLLTAAGLLTFVVVILITPGLHDLADLLWLNLKVLLGQQ